jgi:hypothetical protein
MQTHVRTMGELSLKKPARSKIVVGLVVLLKTANLAAQEPVPPATVVEIPTSPGVPDSRAEWTVEIRTSGGFDGQGNGGFTVTSAGELTCNLSASCIRQIQKPVLQSIEAFVSSANLPLAIQVPSGNPSIPVQVTPSVCSDCIVTTMLLRIRDSKGIAWSYSVSWDLTTQSRVPTDFKRIFEAATALTH